MAESIASKSGFVELWARTNFSFLMGATPPRSLIARAARLGYDTIGITDRDGLYGMVRAMEAAEAIGVRVVIGCELTVEETQDVFSTLAVLVENHVGYTNLCQILTESHARHPKGNPDRPRPKSRRGVLLPKNLYAGIPLSEICARAEGLWALVDPDSTPEHAGMVKEAFGARASVAVHRHFDGEDTGRMRDAVALSSQFEIPLCATNRVLFSEPKERRLYDVLHCIREGCTLQEAGRDLLRNAEAHLKSERTMRALFSDVPEAIARARDIAGVCRFSLRELKYEFPMGSYAVEGETSDETLRKLTYLGAKNRYGEIVPDAVRAQIERELAIIEKVGKAPYFLSVCNIIERAKRRDILCQGRGSAANSAVCYCLGITAVDPSRSNLLFERFLSENRSEPPDIDIDIEHERREELIQEIYTTYGRDRAAMVSEVICYRSKSALREAGKVFGFSLAEVDRLSKLMVWWDKIEGMPEERLVAAGFDPRDKRVRLVLACANALAGFPRHLSIHVGGFVLSAAPLCRVAPVEPATMKDRTIVPWDKDDLDVLGFYKADLLGLGMLTVIRKTLDLVQSRDERVRADLHVDRMAKIPPEDPTVYESLCHADTVGVFQIESRAQMSMLPRLKPRVFYDLVIEVAIVRPGPIHGGMVHPYLRRRNNEEARTMPHPALKPILERTFGVPLFQEQVMQIAMAAGYSAADADQLRRDMAAWRRNGRLEQHRARLAEGFRQLGISDDFAERLYKQIEGFGEYGFPESHASSFALLVYVSAWLKVHHPAAFAAALVNSQPMGFYSASTILQDAQRHGVTVLPIAIDRSHWDCTLESDRTIRAGLRLVKGLGEKAYVNIELARQMRPFESMADFMGRTGLNRRELDLLAQSGALAPLLSSDAAKGGSRKDNERGKSTREAMWSVRAPRDAFSSRARTEQKPSFPALTRGEQLSLDYERTGFSVSDHPMKLLRPMLARQRIWGSRELADIAHGTRVKTAGYVICRQRPGTASGVVFITMEDELGFVNLLLWARVFEQFRHIATSNPLLLAEGKLEREGEVVYVIVERLAALSLPREETVRSMSRDFH